MARHQHIVQLKLRWAKLDEVYKDIVRIPEDNRGNLRAGKIHKFKVGRKSAYFILRGRKADDNGYIVLDEASRDKLGLKNSKFGESYKFTITETGFWGELVWSLNATDPAYRVAARLGVLSFGLGLIALFPVAEWLKCMWHLLTHLFCKWF